jgi:hypothetical protein
LAAQQQDFGFWARDSLRITIPITNAAGEPVSLVGASVEWLLSTYRGGRNPVVTKTVASGITIDRSAAVVSLTPSDTIELSPIRYFHQLRVVLSDDIAPNLA